VDIGYMGQTQEYVECMKTVVGNDRAAQQKCIDKLVGPKNDEKEEEARKKEEEARKKKEEARKEAALLYNEETIKEATKVWGKGHRQNKSNRSRKSRRRRY